MLGLKHSIRMSLVTDVAAQSTHDPQRTGSPTTCSAHAIAANPDLSDYDCSTLAGGIHRARVIVVHQATSFHDHALCDLKVPVATKNQYTFIQISERLCVFYCQSCKHMMALSRYIAPAEASKCRADAMRTRCTVINSCPEAARHKTYAHTHTLRSTHIITSAFGNVRLATQ